ARRGGGVLPLPAARGLRGLPARADALPGRVPDGLEPAGVGDRDAAAAAPGAASARAPRRRARRRPRAAAGDRRARAARDPGPLGAGRRRGAARAGLSRRAARAVTQLRGSRAERRYRGRSSFRQTRRSPDQVASIAQTFVSTSPSGSAVSRTPSSVRSVATPEARFGQAT